MRRSSIRLIGSSAVLLMAGAGLAQEPNMPPTGPAGSGSGGAGGSAFEVAVRAGYGLPLGTASNDVKYSDIISGMIPFWADVGYRIDPNWYIGGFFQFGLGFVPSSGCAAGISCSENDLRFGLNVQYHILPNQTIDPWVGIGAAYEIWNYSASAAGQSASAQLRGFEFGNAQVGADYRISPVFGVGPFVTFTVAQFSDASGTLNGQTQSAGITNKGIHEWLIFGLRGVFDFGLD
jgi:hypothetical protein